MELGIYEQCKVDKIFLNDLPYKTNILYFAHIVHNCQA